MDSTVLQQNNLKSEDTKKVYFENLDFLRFIACFIVFLGHSAPHDLANLLPYSAYNKFVHLVTNGGLAVSFFFVLSGFLITFLLLKEKEKTNTILVKEFYTRRLLRIWPLYLSVVFFGFCIYPYVKYLIGMNSVIPNDPIYYFSFLTNFDSIRLSHLGVLEVSSPEMLAVTWSVAIEEQFYLVWPLLFLIFPKKAYVYVLLATITISCLFRYIHREDGATLYFHTLSVSSDLAIGGLMAYLTLFSTGFTNFFLTIKTKYIALIYILGIAILSNGVYLLPLLKDYAFALRIVSTVFFAFVIAEQNISKHSIVKYSRFRVISYLGRYTYSFYLLHPIGIQMTIILFRILRINHPSLTQEFFYTFLALIFSLLLSFVSFHFLEKPFLLFKKRFEV